MISVTPFRRAAARFPAPEATLADPGPQRTMLRRKWTATERCAGGSV